jgi:AP-1 complex subunit mu
MRAHYKLPSIENDNQDAKPPIEVHFEIPYFTTSGIQVGVDMISYFSHDHLPIVVYEGSIFEDD